MRTAIEPESAVLRSRIEISQARKELKRRNLSCLTPYWRRLLAGLGFPTGILVGDLVKSWDVLKTTDFIRSHLEPRDSVLDIGAYASEILCVLRKLGFSNLTGVDLNPKLNTMPHRDSIRYEVADFTRTSFPNGSFDAITAISVIEHGFQPEALLKEASRLLKPGGYFLISFDYWPEKIETGGIKMFDLSWTIFSQKEVESFVEDARRYGLVGPTNIELSGTEPPIKCAGRRYTFAWMSLQKLPG